MIPRRDMIAKARRDVHEHASVPALYISRVGAVPLPVTVRVHQVDRLLGAMLGVGASGRAFAEVHDADVQLVFLLDEVEPSTGAVVSVAAGEAYKVCAMRARELVRATADATRLSQAACAGLPVPEAS